ncbi:LytTR family DNA-binding domain-containing protein [Methylonatrum kenyense]|uniref:LytR/AlgR family response regulator transcription factor n=1 Tax=Methylonatrum kenyense TaxID=455253 RepID=UPI0020BD926D|nr:LytTR family DNA-binding domain-containing protein [Methylonatrum kenyense]MCK8515296.1 LytTR family DNA-binding domain-containing protein [Methylonatrum kenyense]
MRVLIVDDEGLARERLAQLVSDLGGHQVVGAARDGEDALQQVAELKPDVVLMDIRMPGMDGLQAAAQLNGGEADAPRVIFVTAYGDHALEAFDLQAADYLLKPVNRERLAAALERAARDQAAQRLEVSAQPAPHVLCRRRGDLHLIPLERSRYFEAEQKYVTAVHDDGEDLIDDSLRQLEDRFPSLLLRIHRKALVCRDRIEGLEKDINGRHMLVLRDSGERLEVSRRHLPEVRRVLRELGS